MERFYRLRTKIVMTAFIVFLACVLTAALFHIDTETALDKRDFREDNACGVLSQCDADGDSLPLLAKGGDELIILMYHNVLKKGKRESTYCIAEDALQRDFEYLKSHGYSVVSCAEVIDGVYSGKGLPDRAVLITFDDGYLNNVRYALPLLEKYGYSALFSVVGDYTLLDKDNPKTGGDFVYLGWQDIREASESEAIEIGLHSYSMHNLRPRLGVAQLKSESDEEYSKIFADDTDRLIEALNSAQVKGRYGEIYAYPYGKYNKISERVLKEKGVKMTLTCNEGINTVSSAEDLYLLKRLNRDATKSSLDEILLPYEKILQGGKA